jgi:hypothetical protein
LHIFALSVTTSLKIPGAVIPRRVFTRPGIEADIDQYARMAGSVENDPVASKSARLLLCRFAGLSEDQLWFRMREIAEDLDLGSGRLRPHRTQRRRRFH